MSCQMEKSKIVPTRVTDSWYNKLVVPIIIAIVAGGSAPWWVEYVKQYLAHPPIPTPSRDAPAEAASKVEIGHFYHRENGCHSSSQSGRFTIENADKLDRTRPGTIQGVTVEVYAANGGQITDAHFENQKVFVVIGTATGGGHWVSNPLGGGVCVGATGADIGAHVYGFFH